MRKCTIPDCRRPHLARGWCRLHYLRWRAHGTVSLNEPKRHSWGSPYERVMQYVESKDGCLVCSLSPNAAGYATVTTESGSRMAHRIVWEHHNGPIPDGQVIRHQTCDNPPCVDIEHLALGTHQDNINDKVEKNRQAKGECNGASKLNEQAVASIRLLLQQGTGQREIAARFNVSQSTISKINRSETWN